MKMKKLILMLKSKKRRMGALSGFQKREMTGQLQEQAVVLYALLQQHSNVLTSLAVFSVL